MISHTIGLPNEFNDKNPSLEDLAAAKHHPGDIALYDGSGFEAWKTTMGTGDATVHVMMAGNIPITQELLDKFKHLGVTRFVVGHTHYRSGDVDFGGELITVYSSQVDSPSAGHFDYQEMVVEAMAVKKDGTEGFRHREGREGTAPPCYLEVDLTSDDLDLAKTKRPLGRVVAREFNDLTDSMAVLRGKADRAYDAKTAMLEGELADYKPPAPQTLILCAEPLLANGGVLDLEEMESMVENNILENVVVYAKDPAKARVLTMLLKDLNKKLRAEGKKTLTVIEGPAGEIDPDAPEVDEVRALVEFAKGAGAVTEENILGIVKGPSQDPDGLKGLSEALKVPIVAFKDVTDNALYSLADAVAHAVAARKRLSDWFIEIEPLNIETDIHEELNRYRESLRLLTAA